MSATGVVDAPDPKANIPVDLAGSAASVFLSVAVVPKEKIAGSGAVVEVVVDVTALEAGPCAEKENEKDAFVSTAVAAVVVSTAADVVVATTVSEAAGLAKAPKVKPAKLADVVVGAE